jgi:hypothetical protein
VRDKQERKRLDGAGRNHLPLEVLLVLADAAIPAGDGLVLAHHDVLGDLVEETVINLLVDLSLKL